MNKNIIAHIADLHIRFGSRHEEYKKVFERLIKDLKEQKPRRIVIAGDIFHLKINLSPFSIDIAGNLMRELSKIAPVDILIGNHDFNNQDLSQGNSISPLIELLENGFIINANQQAESLPQPKSGYGVYFYRDSGFYEVEDDLIYGIYSLLDGEILSLKNKEKGKKYIALYHGPVYGCMSDNGFQLKGDELIKITAFNNFDIVMLGDIHEYQSFNRNGVESAAFSGSLLQQNFGESILKGYLIWDLNAYTHERRYVPNDYGFCKLNISKGEIIEERLEDLVFSLDKKKTRIYIELEDEAENENVEKKSQIRKWIKDRHGCDNITVEFKPIHRDKQLSSEEEVGFEDAESFEKLLIEWLKQNSYENIEDVLDLSKEIESKLGSESKSFRGIDWDLNKMETYNIFSHPAVISEFDFDKMGGITGIFGKNYSGKSNLIKALGWGLYEKIIGGGDNHKIVNLYTGVNKAWVRIYLTISGVKYRIQRGITVTSKKDGTTKAIYAVRYEYLTFNENNEPVWEPEDSERAAKEKKEFKKLITDSIGTFEEFTKVCLQTQGGKDDYLSLQQQPKNDLIRKFMGLEIFDIKYEIANDTFKKIKSTQKSWGDPADLEKEVENYRAQIKDKKDRLTQLIQEKTNNSEQIEVHNEQILELTKKLQKLENTKYESIKDVEQEVDKLNNSTEKITVQINELDEYTSNNFLKEIPIELQSLNKQTLEKNILNIKNRFQENKNKYIEVDKWIKENPKKENIEDTGPLEESILENRTKLKELELNLKIAKGEKCPTCKQVTKQANLELEKEIGIQIENLTTKILQEQTNLTEVKNNISHNIKFDRTQNELDSLKNNLQADKNEIDSIKINIDKLGQIESDVIFNSELKKKIELLNQLKNQKQDNISKVTELSKEFELIKKNEQFKLNNKNYNDKILNLQNSLKEYKIVLNQIDSNIKDVSGDVKVLENNVENLLDKLKQIKESVRIYNKYSIYLQAVSRDGIPAHIIKKKLPIVNYRINSILNSIVNFNIEMFIKNNGDVQEMFYFNPDKSDSLPLSMGSGSQKFIGSIAITDALHAVSCLMKPNLRIIDEGFGTLDEDKTADIGKVFSYLRNRYKNVLIITHRSEIKDFVDNIIQVSKTTSGLSKEQVEVNPEAGISQFSLTC